MENLTDQQSPEQKNLDTKENNETAPPMESKETKQPDIQHEPRKDDLSTENAKEMALEGKNLQLPEVAQALIPDIQSQPEEQIVSEEPIISNENEGGLNRLQQFWNAYNFPEKHLCKMDQHGNLFRIESKHLSEKKIGHISESNAHAVIEALVEKFKEVEKRHEHFLSEWDKQSDVLRMHGKLERNKTYILNTPALGNLEPMLEKYNEHSTEINKKFKENEDLRKTIVEKAILLKDSDEFKNASEEFKNIIREWKQAPYVDKIVNDALWQEIEDARNAFYERKRANFEEVEKEMMQNLDLKLELCEKAEALADSEDWRTTTETYKALMEQWKEIGRVASHEKNEELWSRFITPKIKFFERKDNHQSQIRTEQEENYLAKLKLVEQAEAIKESKNWKETADEYAKILEGWKSIGRVPKEHSDELWERMQTAKNHFFDAKRQQSEIYKISLEDNYARKKSLVDRIEAIKNSTNWKEATIEINELMAVWKTIGPIPREYGDDLWEHFISARKHFFKQKDEDRKDRKQKFIQRIQNRIAQSNQFLSTLEEELAEDESKLEEFNEILNNTEEEDAKDKEIKENIVRLISQIENKLPNRKAKIENVKEQIAELESKLQDDDA